MDYLSKAKEVLEIEAQGIAAIQDRLDDAFIAAAELILASQKKRVNSLSPVSAKIGISATNSRPRLIARVRARPFYTRLKPCMVTLAFLSQKMYCWL